MKIRSGIEVVTWKPVGGRRDMAKLIGAVYNCWVQMSLNDCDGNLIKTSTALTSANPYEME
jgi:hypothetical protein